MTRSPFTGANAQGERRAARVRKKACTTRCACRAIERRLSRTSRNRPEATRRVTGGIAVRHPLQRHSMGATGDKSGYRGRTKWKRHDGTTRAFPRTATRLTVRMATMPWKRFPCSLEARANPTTASSAHYSASIGTHIRSAMKATRNCARSSRRYSLTAVCQDEARSRLTWHGNRLLTLQRRETAA